MPDPVDPTPPPAPSPSPLPSGNPTSTGLPSNVAAALACVPLVGGLIFYILEKHDQFVRFYAMQSIIYGGAWFLFNIISMILHRIFWALPVIGPIFAGLWLFVSALVHLGLLVIMIIAMVKAFTGVRWDIPFVGPIARKQMGETP
ncbi:MAG TPA: hypothetical protein VNP98_12430 [Chthoniobacterales bacterium]|nr:hypothetical protein [Chthoniobacterales bacterium]